MKGNIKFFNKDRGYGFIVGEDDLDYFFGFNNILNKANLKTNDKVEFSPSRTRKGLHALNVIKVEEWEIGFTGEDWFYLLLS